MIRNAQDIIDDMRNIVKPRIAKMLLDANFEGCGKEDKAEFETEFEMILTLAEKALEQEPCEDVISRKSIKQKLQEHHDFFVNAYGGFSNLPQNDKSRVDEITNCIAMVVNEPPVTPQEPILEKINKMKSEIADSLEFWDYSPNNNPLARDMLETITNFWGDMREVKE